MTSSFIHSFPRIRIVSGRSTRVHSDAPRKIGARISTSASACRKKPRSVGWEPSTASSPSSPSCASLRIDTTSHALSQRSIAVYDQARHNMDFHMALHARCLHSEHDGAWVIHSRRVVVDAGQPVVHRLGKDLLQRLAVALCNQRSGHVSSQR